MKINGERFIPGARADVWAALNDADALRQCIPGCESIEADGGQAFDVVMLAKVGPVSARFKGRIQMSDLDPPTSYALGFEGQGGVAGFGKGTAQVRLSDALRDEVAGTLLNYEASAQVGGKLAQIGSRLVDAAAAKLTADFFGRFEQLFAPPPAQDESGAAPSLWARGRSWLKGTA